MTPRQPEIADNDNHRRNPGRADPWIVRKGGVGFLIAISIYSAYVFIGRLCVPIIRDQAPWSRGAGVGLLIGYIILGLMYSWTYMRMLSKGPGFAIKLVPQVDAPTETVNPVLPDPPDLAPLAALVPTVATDNTTSSLAPDRSKPKWETLERPIPQIQYGPRWCRFCKINKPDRTHHCRHCGTCVLQFDHHCIWVGQCVGWANHKFFMTFCFWASLFCLYMLATLIAYLTTEIDGQMIAIIALSALFGVFTTSMFGSHVYLIMTGKSTVESFAAQDQSQHESRYLQSHLGWMGSREASKAKKMWRQEWGGSAIDERWRVGGARRLWKQEMGAHWYEWIFPVGRPLGDGMHFASNPRFGPNGEWLRKRDWPVDA